MKDLLIDIETFSNIDLAKCGVYKYAEDNSFRVLLFGYSIDFQPPKLIDLTAGEDIPYEIVAALKDTAVSKWAHNAQFERICLSKNRSYVKYLLPESWYCTMVHAQYLTLTPALKSLSELLKLEKGKEEAGKNLIPLFCKPDKNGVIHDRTTDPEKWEIFKRYCIRDVEAEIELKKKLDIVPVPQAIWDEYHLDQRINDNGIALDMSLVNAAVDADENLRMKLKSELAEITELDNPNSAKQLKDWLSNRGIDAESLSSDIDTGSDDKAKAALEVRKELASTATKKFQSMQKVACSDGRARGLFQYYGASRTGRWAGRLIQVQNLARGESEEDVIADAREAVRDSEEVPMSLLSSIVRTAIVAQKGDLYIADFSAIEARVLAWLAGENWRLDVFKGDGKIYEHSASRMFSVPVESIDKKSPLRQKGKIAELALGYGGGVGALKRMGALDMGLKEHELQPLVDTWRAANPRIVQLWKNLESAAFLADDREEGKCVFGKVSKFMTITLPSGRKLFYNNPHSVVNKFGGNSFAYYGVGMNRKWCEQETYGAKLAENVTQAIARDLLMCAMVLLSDYKIVMHVHDEVVIESETDITDKVREAMTTPPKWAEGLPLACEVIRAKYYKK